MVEVRARGTVSNYNLLKRLGSGGQGEVFLGSPKDNDDIQVAVKFFEGINSDDDEIMREFQMQ